MSVVLRNTAMSRTPKLWNHGKLAKPSVTGAKVCSRALAARRFRLPWLVRKPWGEKRALEFLLC